jgi:uncharacterized protein (UPF0548 family)
VIRPYGEKGLVEIAGSAEEAVAKAETLMAATGQRSEWLARVDRHLAAGSWDETWRQMQSLIGKGMSKPRSATASRRGRLDALSLSAAE